jgi:radical SAM superfamily enzyme YgiQ (UPF0313 family)
MEMSLQPSEEVVGVDTRYQWEYPLPARAAAGPAARVRSVWYVGLPLSSAHRGSHHGGGALIEGIDGQEKYRNEGCVYPHAGLVEMITYHQRYVPDVAWRYIDMSHYQWPEVRAAISEDPPDVIALSVYTATAVWAMIVAAEVKRVNPAAIVIFGNDHAGVLYRETLTGSRGSRIVDFVSTGNNGPFTMLGLLHMLRGQLDLGRVPSIAYRHGDQVVNQAAPTYPLSRRLLPDYRLLVDHLERFYDKAFDTWYGHHYELKRMVTLPIDGGCTWGRRPTRRCRHCSIQGLTPKTTEVGQTVPVLETLVGELGANVYAAGDSTFGFSRGQWNSNVSFLDDLAEACAGSPVLRGRRFMLMYGLVQEFLQAAELCSGFVRTWNVGFEAFDPALLKKDSKGVNKGPDRINEALELASRLNYKVFASGILGLPGSTLKTLSTEVENWLRIAETYQDMITTVSVSPPGIIPGSRMYWDLYNDYPQVRSWHGELLPARRLTELYLRQNTEVDITDVEAALNDLGRGVIELSQRGGKMKFGSSALGGTDSEELRERRILADIWAGLGAAR